MPSVALLGRGMRRHWQPLMISHMKCTEGGYASTADGYARCALHGIIIGP